MRKPRRNIIFIKKVCRDCIKPFLANNWKKGGEIVSRVKSSLPFPPFLGLLSARPASLVAPRSGHEAVDGGLTPKKTRALYPLSSALEAVEKDVRKRGKRGEDADFAGGDAFKAAPGEGIANVFKRFAQSQFWNFVGDESIGEFSVLLTLNQRSADRSERGGDLSVTPSVRPPAPSFCKWGRGEGPPPPLLSPPLFARMGPSFLLFTPLPFPAVIKRTNGEKKGGRKGVSGVGG